MSTQFNFSPRLRFNWGFHDATFDRDRGLYPSNGTSSAEPRPERDRRNLDSDYARRFPLPAGEGEGEVAYRAGYEAGMTCDMTAGRPSSSEQAWLVFVATLEGAAVARGEGLKAHL